MWPVVNITLLCLLVILILCYCLSVYLFCPLESGKVYSWGSNQYGQLGLDDTDDRPTPTAIEPLYNTSITVEEVETISANNSGVLPSVHTVTDDMVSCTLFLVITREIV